MYSTQLSFSDILLEPQYSEIRSRSSVDLATNLGPIELKLPVISANMKHVTGVRMSVAMAKAGGLGIQHRFKPIEESVQDYLETVDLLWKEKYIDRPFGLSVGVSIGVNKDSKDRFNALYNEGARLFCIDVAHGHHILVKEMIEWIRQETKHKHSDPIVIIAGNVATSDGAMDLYRWGADIVKVGIGPGAACMTRRNTGHGVSQFNALMTIREQCHSKDFAKIPIISDGGIQHFGDIPKALLYADACMMGSMFAGTSETPGNVHRNENNQLYKVYGGSASGENKVDSGQKQAYVEGIMKTVQFKGHVHHILSEIADNLRSACSYSGSKSLSEFKKKAKWHVISGGAKAESKI